MIILTELQEVLNLELRCLCSKTATFLLKETVPKTMDMPPLHSYCIQITMGTAVAQWLRCCATNRKVAGSIPAGVGGFFIDIKSFRLHYGPGDDSASNRNVYQEYFLGVKAASA